MVIVLFVTPGAGPRMLEVIFDFGLPLVMVWLGARFFVAFTFLI